MKESILKELNKLESRRTALLIRAKKEALVDAKKAIDVLNSLGGNYTLIDKDTKKNAPKFSATTTRGRRSGTKSRKGTRKPKDASCPICNFRTSPPHDRRTHRMQENKKPFSKRELSKRGYSIV